MKWNLRLAAAQRSIWRASDLRRLLAEQGLVVSAGKMSHLWSGTPISIRLDDLDVICSVLDCQPGDLLIRDREAVGQDDHMPATAIAANTPTVRPKARRGHKPQPPV
jgi:putative transcriptional regulator